MKSLLAIMMAVLSCAPESHAASVTAEESKLRAAIVLGILRFTTWPDQAQIASEINLCTYGTPLAEPALNQVSGVRMLNNTPVKVVTVHDMSASITGCDALVLGKNAALDAVSKARESGALHGVLTICDDCKGEDLISMVKLIRVDKRIGFEIDMRRARESDMYFSSALLELAVEVRR